MNPTQPQTNKVSKKRSQRGPNESPGFICGACLKPYKSYSALYLHLKRKHDGLRPPGTKIQKRTRAPLDLGSKVGRPQKSDKNVDDIGEPTACLEVAQNDLMRLLGEELAVTSILGPKLSLEVIVQKITEASQNKSDKWMKELEECSKDFLSEHGEKDLTKKKILDFEEDFIHLDPSNGVKVIVWFMIWLGKVYVKFEFIPELCLIFSKIWKVMDETGLGAEDLDNKLVWKKIIQECEEIMTNLPLFKNNSVLLNDFIRSVCKIIGKAFEENSK